MKSKFGFCFLLVAILTLITSCSWHRKEIAYIKTTYYNKERVNSSDSSKIQSVSEKTEHQDGYSFRESKYNNFKTGESIYQRYSVIKYEQTLIEGEPTVIEPIFTSKTIQNDSINSNSFSFNYSQKDTVNEIYTHTILASTGLKKNEMIVPF